MITGIILASGLSRRMAGQDKLLLPVDGTPLVERVMQAADASRLDDIILAYQNPAVANLPENIASGRSTIPMRAGTERFDKSRRPRSSSGDRGIYVFNR